MRKWHERCHVRAVTWEVSCVCSPNPRGGRERWFLGLTGQAACLAWRILGQWEALPQSGWMAFLGMMPKAVLWPPHTCTMCISLHTCTHFHTHVKTILSLEISLIQTKFCHKLHKGLAGSFLESQSTSISFSRVLWSKAKSLELYGFLQMIWRRSRTHRD